MTNYLHKVLVTGSNGQLATAIANLNLPSEFNFIFLNRDGLDITKPADVDSVVKELQPTIIINTAAFTAVDKAEDEESTCLQVNYEGAKNLAICANHYSIPLIHISTDYIFDGNNTRANKEEDASNPINIYGKSKLLGEEAIAKHCPQNIILRVSGIFSEYGNNFLKTMLRLAQEKNELSIVADQYTCPTYATDIASALLNMIPQLSDENYGTYHFCNKEATSWHDFACKIISESKKYFPIVTKNIRAIPSVDYPTPASRPKNSVLNCSKIRDAFGIQQNFWQAGIMTTLRKLAS